MALHVVVGAGAIGSVTALELSRRGQQVRVLSRSGAGPAEAGIERLAIDALDTKRVVEAATGAAAPYNCANPLRAPVRD